MIGFRAVKALVGSDRRVNDCASPRGFAVARKLGPITLPLVMVKNDRAVLAWAPGGGIVTLPEDGQEFFITDLGWVEVDLDGLGVVGDTAIGGGRLITSSVSDPCADDPLQTPEPGVRPPESAQGECCRGAYRRDEAVNRWWLNLRIRGGCRHGAGSLDLYGVVRRTAGSRVATREKNKHHCHPTGAQKMIPATTFLAAGGHIMAVTRADAHDLTLRKLS